MKPDRVLIVEDSPDWVEDYKRWLRHEDFDIDVASSSKEALERLRIAYFALLILDLSLDPDNPANRDSVDVQEYLQRNPEGTQHIVISAHAGKDDVRIAAFRYKAHDVLFKNEFEDPSKFINLVRTAIIKSHEQRPNFVEQGYSKIISGEDASIFELSMLKSLKPKDGAKGYLAFKDKLLEVISPIELHKTRNQFTVIDDQFVFALYWSRRLGAAISLCLANANVNDEAKRKAMTDWLGWDSGKEWKLIKDNNVKGYIHLEDGLAPDDFILPAIN